MKYLNLIALYYYISDCYNKELYYHCQRYSRNKKEADFTDVELLTIYIYCVREEERTKVKSIYQYAQNYLLSWFPDLPSYQAFNNRLNRLAPVFPYLVQSILNDIGLDSVHQPISLLDSMPIITCSSKRDGKVARALTDKGYCATKRLHYYGIKIHAIAFSRKGQLPLPEFMYITPASTHDLTAVRPILARLYNRVFIADKIYMDRPLNKELLEKNDCEIYTPVKLLQKDRIETRQFKFAADKLFSTAVSRIRQPIESLFNWLIEKTDIQRASKVRSTKGLIVHVFGKIAAALSTWAFNP